MEHDESRPPFVTIDRFYDPTAAHIAAGQLESEGIPVFLLGINHASMNWLIAPALGGIQLQVPPQHETTARSILAHDNALDDPEENCPQCGSTNTSLAFAGWKISFLALHLIQLPLPWRQPGRKCDDCGNRWTDSDNT